MVEDDFVLAEDLREELEGRGADVLGPIPGVAEALDLLARGPAPDAALLDINLGGDLVFPVADVLADRGIPFAFATGYDGWIIPGAYAHVRHFDKPVEMRQLVHWLLG